jgi:SHS2 domain-containing protein
VSFELKEHTADVAVEATAASRSAVFADVADGMAAAMSEDVPEGVGDRFAFEERAETPESLLFDYLDRLIYERDVRGVLPVDNEARVSETTVEGDTDEGDTDEGGDPATEWVVEASARGVPLSEVHARDLKAVTYSEMDLSERDSGWHAYVVFDV